MADEEDASADQLLEFADKLLDLVDEEFSRDAWRILNYGTESSKLKIYKAATMRHCANLLRELAEAGFNGNEMSLRIVGRAHIEAFVYGMYLALGDWEALNAVAADSKFYDEALANDLDNWNEWVTERTHKAKRRLRAVRAANAAIVRFNECHPPDQHKSLHPEPHIPRQNVVDYQTTDLRQRLPGVVKAELPLRQLIDQLEGLARKKGLGSESFQPIYHVYRVLSGLGTHPTLDVLDSYIDQEPSATFISARRTPVTGSAFLMTITNAIYSTALLAEWLSPSRTTEALEIRRMRSLLEPVDGDTRGWTPGL